MRISFFIVIFFSLSVTVQAQIIKGKLVDPADGKPLAGATLKLRGLKDSTVKYNTISDKTGSFRFENVILDSFMLQVSFVGYENYKQIIGVKDTLLDMGIVSVPKTVKQLGEVVVVSKPAPVQQKQDTIEYNASQFKVNPDANAEDLIKKTPGITVDKSGTVTAQGEQVKKVTVDGRDFFGDDATAALRNLPAEIIDKIQVFDKLSDQAQFTGFDDGNTVKAINIVTKADMRNGQFGRVYAGYGTDDRYQAGGNMSFFKDYRRISFVGLANNINQQNFATQDLLGVTSSGGRGGFGGGGGGNFGGRQRGGNGGGNNNPRGGNNFGFGGGQQNFLVGQQSGISKTNAIGINYSDQWGKKFTVSGSYFFNNSNNNDDQILNRRYPINADSTLYYNQNSLSSSRNYNNRINLRMEYKIDSSNSILITPSLSFQSNNSISNLNALNQYNSDSLVSQSMNNSDATTSGYTINNTALYRHAFHKRGRTVSIGVTTSFNKKTGNSYLQAKNTYYTSGSQNDSLQQLTDNLNNGYTVSTNIAYTEPIGKKGQLQINYVPSFSQNKADQETYQYDYVGKQYSLFDTVLSNKFNSTYNTQNGGISYRVGDRDNQFSVGVSYQYSQLASDRQFPFVETIKRSFNNVLYNLQLRRKLSSKSRLNLFYRTSVSAPSITQLQDVINNNNTLQLSTGNPDLKQQMTHSVVARYTFTNTVKGQSFFANFFVQKMDDYIANATYIASADSVLAPTITLHKGSQLIKPVNLDGYWSARSFLTFGTPIKFLKSNLNLSAGMTYTRLPGMLNTVQDVTNNYTYNTGVVLASNVSQYVDFNLSYNASFNVIEPNTINNYTTQSAGVEFNLLSKKGWYLQNDLTNESYKYKDTSATDQNYWLWNVSMGKKFLKDQKGDLKFSVFDLLKQNRSITRNVTESYVEDVQNKVLTQYFMLTFTYKLKNFGKAKVNNNNENNRFRRQMPPF